MIFYQVRQGQVFKNSSQLVKLSIIMLKANHEKHLTKPFKLTFQEHMVYFAQ